jgi:hypothetical protein
MFASAQMTQNKASMKAERGWMSLYLVLGLCLGLWVSCLTRDRLQEPCAKHEALSSFILLPSSFSCHLAILVSKD